MATSEKRSVEPLYIQMYPAKEWVCEYLPSKGSFNELKLSDTKVITSKGFYVKNEGTIIGLFASTEGPVIFKDDTQIPLELGKYNMELEEQGANRIFKLIVNGEEVFVIKYEKPRFANWDVWSDEETLDFFSWLYKNQNDDQFHRFYSMQG